MVVQITGNWSEWAVVEYALDFAEVSQECFVVQGSLVLELGRDAGVERGEVECRVLVVGRHGVG